MASEIDTDYLVVGAGAMGMAFVDELLCRDPKAHVTMVDRRAAPGGHWNDAYPFVRLHQPALFYGVSSEHLGSGGRDLVSKGEILGYYDRVLRKLVATGRLTFLGQHDHEGDGRVRSLLAPGRVHHVRARRRLVDATLSGTEVPATTPPAYRVEPDAPLVPINGIAHVKRPWARYVIVGAGKTGMDAVLHLLAQGVAADAITWVVSRDAWLIDRARIYPDAIHESLLAQTRACQEASDVEDLFLRLEADGYLCRIDPGRTPTAYRCATVSRDELERLRAVEDVVRLGHVTRVERGTMHLERGTIALAGDTLVVDCSANGLAHRKPLPVYTDGRITLQPVAVCQPTFSAAIIAKLETLSLSDEQRNAMTRAAPYPRVPSDLPAAIMAHSKNIDGWMRTMLPWLFRARLNAAAHASVLRTVPFLLRIRPHLKPAQDNLRRISAAASSGP